MSAFLVVVDMQMDFLFGSLAISGAQKLCTKINPLVKAAETFGIQVIYTLDYHKPEHPSFIAQGGQWPTHCVAGTEGQQLDSLLYVADNAIFIPKGYHEESYAADLSGVVPSHSRVTCVGVATDYCVKETAFKLREDLFCDVTIVGNATAAVREQEAALSTLRDMGFKIVNV